MFFENLNNIPKELFSSDWRVREFDGEKKLIPTTRGIYVIALNLNNYYKEEEDKPNIFKHGFFYPIYIGYTFNFRRRIGEHIKDKPFLNPIKSNIDFWYLKINETEKKLKIIEKNFINALFTVVNKKYDLIEDIYKAKDESDKKNDDTLYNKNKIEWIKSIISENQIENEQLEFKESYAFNVKAYEKSNVVKKDLELITAILKVIVGYLNTKGGNLLIGISDKGEIIGVEKDLQFFFHGSLDKLKGELEKKIEERLSSHARTKLSISSYSINNKTIILINVTKAFLKSFLDESDFYYKDSHGVKKLKAERIDSWWKERNKNL